MYTNGQSRGLRGGRMGATNLTQPVEGEALITAGSASAAEAQRAGEILLQPYDPTMAAGAMQTVRPDAPAECPPCPPPSVIYRDRIVEKRIPVVTTIPGPTRYVYVTTPGPVRTPPTGFATYDEWYNTFGRSAGLPYNPPGGGQNASPEPAPAGAGEDGPGAGSGVDIYDIDAGSTGKGILWWVIAAAAGTAWYLESRKKRGR